MNYEAVFRTAPATPGLLNTNNKKFKLTSWHSICQETSSAEEACEAKLGVNWTIINCALDRDSVALGQFHLQCHYLTYTLYSCGVLCCTTVIYTAPYIIHYTREQGCTQNSIVCDGTLIQQIYQELCCGILCTLDNIIYTNIICRVHCCNCVKSAQSLGTLGSRGVRRFVP